MARNNITNDLIANTKGSAEKYAQGWDAIFGRKEDSPEGVGGWTRTVPETEPYPYWTGEVVGEEVEWSGPFTSEVNTIDFHDSAPATQDRHHFILYRNILENDILWEYKSA